MLRRLLITIFAFAALTGLGQSRAHPDPKLAYTFNRIEHQNDYNDSLTVSIALSHGSHLNKLISVQCSYRNYLRARIRLADLPAIIKDSSILFITPLVTPTEELTTGASDPTLNGISLVHARLPQLKGRSLHTSIKERLFDTSDIDFKGRIEKTGVEPASVTAHASLMATIVAGAGNSSLYARGAASMATLSSASFLNLFPEPDSIINRYGISVENHSYGTTVENFYGSEAAAYDMQANQIGSLLHVFSAGNAGDFNNSGGPYTGVQQMANLTGNFKQAKNIITVGSIDSAGQLMPLSSKGPAYDGRIKPDLMAYGEDGSSGAAALVSGAALLVQDAYKQETNRVPPFSLVKAALINAADDVGAPQVDYASGFGSLNAYRAVQTISEHRFIEASSTQGSITGFNLHIPPGIQQLKLTLVWNDPAASPNSAKALINDLDLQLYFPQTGERWDPWVLDPSPNLISLQSVPQRKKDTLNNVEQVTLDQPAEGDYTIEVKGSKINSITQSFALAWQLDTLNSFYWSYPSATDPLIARSTAWLRWNTNMTGVGEIEYATANNNWRSVGIVPDLSKKYFKWTLPDTLATAVLRMKQSSVRAFVSDTFTISPQLQLKTGFVCEDSFLLYWRSIAASYRLFELSSEYLTPFMQLSDTVAFLNQQQHASLYYAVAPLVNNHEGIRSNTLNYAAQGAGCYIRSFFLRDQTSAVASFSAELGTLYGVAEISLQKLSPAGFVNIQTIRPPADLLNFLDDTSLQQGENLYRLRILLLNGRTVFSAPIKVYHLPSSPVVLYPNPVRQNSQLKIISNEVGRYTLWFIDAGGRVLFTHPVNSSMIMLNAGTFSKGIYFIRIMDSKGSGGVQRLVVY